MKWICERCGELIDDCDVKRSAYRPCRSCEDDLEDTCPHCGSDNLVEAVQCECCGEYVKDYEIQDGVCKECIGEMFAEE